MELLQLQYFLEVARLEHVTEGLKSPRYAIVAKQNNSASGRRFRGTFI